MKLDRIELIEIQLDNLKEDHFQKLKHQDRHREGMLIEKQDLLHLGDHIMIQCLVIVIMLKDQVVEQDPQNQNQVL